MIKAKIIKELSEIYSDAILLVKDGGRISFAEKDLDIVLPSIVKNGHRVALADPLNEGAENEHGKVLRISEKR